MELKEIIEAGLTAQSVKLDAAIAKFEGQLAQKGTVDTEVKAEVKTLSEEFKLLSAQMTALAQKSADGFKAAEAPLSAAEEFVKSPQYQLLLKGESSKARLEVKNTVTANNTTTFPLQRPGMIPGNFAPLTIRQVLSSIPVSTNMVNSLRELAWTNSAAEVSQGAAKNQSDITFEQYNVPITTVAHWIKISNQLLADAPAVVAYIETRLRDGLAQRIDAQLLNGNGTSPNLSGLTDSGNFTAYTASSDDLLVDAINRAKYALWAIGNAPDTVIVNPADWGTMERTREYNGGVAGSYLYGMPGVAAGVNPFGVQVVMSNNMALGKFLIGNLRGSTALYARSGAVVEMGYVNEDFTNNLITVRAEERLGLGVERPSAILYGDFTA
ncbi:MAG: phage major capsid protein [Rhodoferax sp.]|nr:phage major capsid protein [Rhodoferax sp.]